MEVLDRALVNVCSLLIVTILLIQLGRSVPLVRALVNSYRLSIVTVPLTEVVWKQFSIQAFGGAVRTPIWGDWSHRGLNLYYRVAVGQPYLLLPTILGKTYRLATNDRR